MAASRGICCSAEGNEFGGCCRETPTAPLLGFGVGRALRTPIQGLGPSWQSGAGPQRDSSEPPSSSHFAAQLRSKWPAAGPGPLPISHARSGADNVPKALGGLVPSTFPGAPLSPAAPLGAGPAGTPGTPPAPARPRAPSSSRASRLHPALPRFGVGARGPGGLLASATPFFLTPGPPGTQGGVWYVPARPHSPNWSRLLRRRRRSAGTGVGPEPMLQRLVAPQWGHIAP